MITIAMPAYNAGKYIKECIDSILAQTYTEWELIITDDCSTDNTVTIVEEYTAKYNNIRLIKRKHNSGGCRLPRFDAILAAKGEFVCPIDSDDTIETDYLDKLIKRQKETNSDIVLGRMLFCDEQQNKSWQLAILGDGPEREFYKNLSHKLGLNNVTFTGTVSPLPYYQRASILCITSTHEGFSLAATEALQNVVIPIAYDSYATISDIIQDKVNGFLITPFSEKKYKETLLSLMTDDKLREKTRENIRRINIDSKFDTSLIVDKWERLIAKIYRKEVGADSHS